jgi:hypothetical protein
MKRKRGYAENERNTRGWSCHRRQDSRMLLATETMPEDGVRVMEC